MHVLHPYSPAALSPLGSCLQSVVRPSCCSTTAAAFAGLSKTASSEAQNPHLKNIRSNFADIRRSRWTQHGALQQATGAPHGMHIHEELSNGCSTQDEQQHMWCTDQYEQLVLQLQQPAEQVQRELLLHRSVLHSIACSTTAHTTQSVAEDNNCSDRQQWMQQSSNSSSSCNNDSFELSRLSRAHPGSFVVAAAAPAEASSSRHSQASSSGPETANTTNSSSLKSIRERMKQRVASRITQSANAASPDSPNTSVLSAERLPPILPSATNETSMVDVLQQLQRKLGDQYSKPNATGDVKSSSNSRNAGQGSSSVGRKQPANGADSADVDRKGVERQPEQIDSRPLFKQQQQQLLLQEQQQRQKQQLMHKARLKEQRAAAFKQLQASADVLFKHQTAAAGRTVKGQPNSSSSSSTVIKASPVPSSSTSSRGAATALKPVKAKQSAEASRRRSGPRRGPNKSGYNSGCNSSPAVAAAAMASEAASSPVTPRQLARQLGLGTAVVRRLLKITANIGAPEMVQQQLLASYAAQKPGIPRNLQLLKRRLMQFDQAAALLGGPDRACNIIEQDETLLLMSPVLLQQKLQNLQRLFAGHGTIQPAEYEGEDCGSSTSGSEDCDSTSALTAVENAAASSSRFSPNATVLGLVRSHPGVLRLSVSGLSSRLAALQAALGLDSMAAVLQVVRWQPRVLVMNEEALQEKVWGLATTIRVPPSSIQSLYTKQPLLLNLSASTLTERTTALQSTLGLSPLELWEMLCCKPGVLLFSSNKISRKWAMLQQLAGSHPRWRSELAELSPSSLVQLLTASDARLARLHHVVAVEGQDQQALYYTINQQSPATFKAKFPTYDSWLAQFRKKHGTISSSSASPGLDDY